jgi:hypothetical protein
VQLVQNFRIEGGEKELNDGPCIPMCDEASQRGVVFFQESRRTLFSVRSKNGKLLLHPDTDILVTN